MSLLMEKKKKKKSKYRLDIVMVGSWLLEEKVEETG